MQYNSARMWLIYALSSISLFVTLRLLSKVLITDSKNERAFGFLYNGFSGLIALLGFVMLPKILSASKPSDIFDISVETSLTPWIILLFAAIFYGFFARNRFTVIKHLDVSINSVIGTLAPVVAMIGSIFLYNEEISLKRVLGIIMVISATLIVATTYKNGKKAAEGKYLILAVVTSIFLGLGWMLDKGAVEYFGAGPYNVFVYLSPLIFIYLPKIEKTELVSEFKKYTWKIPFIGLIGVSAFYLMLTAFSMGDVTQVIPVVQTSPVITVLLGIFLLDERNDIPKKVIASVLAFIGILVISL